MSNEYVLTPLEDLQAMANALKEATGNSGEMSYDDFKGVVVNIKDEIGGGGGGTFTLRIVAVEERIDCINYIYYSSNGQFHTWEWDGIPVSEIIINDVDVESIIVIDAGVFDNFSQGFMEESTGNYPEHNLTRVVSNVIYIGHQVGSTEIIEISVYS